MTRPNQLTDSAKKQIEEKKNQKCKICGHKIGSGFKIGISTLNKEMEKKFIPCCKKCNEQKRYDFAQMAIKDLGMKQWSQSIKIGSHKKGGHDH